MDQRRRRVREQPRGICISSLPFVTEILLDHPKFVPLSFVEAG